jgi:hypothetical protein
MIEALLLVQVCNLDQFLKRLIDVWGLDYENLESKEME